MTAEEWRNVPSEEVEAVARLRTIYEARDERQRKLNEKLLLIQRLQQEAEEEETQLGQLKGTRLHRGVPVRRWSYVGNDGEHVCMGSLTSPREATVAPSHAVKGAWAVTFRDVRRAAANQGDWGTWGDRWVGNDWPDRDEAERAALDFVAGFPGAEDARPPRKTEPAEANP